MSFSQEIPVVIDPVRLIPGPPGPQGPSRSYIHVQDVASSAWVIEHDLNKFPSVTIVDSGKNVVEGEVTYIDSFHLIVKFSGEFSGTAYLN